MKNAARRACASGGWSLEDDLDLFIQFVFLDGHALAELGPCPESAPLFDFRVRRLRIPCPDRPIGTAVDGVTRMPRKFSDGFSSHATPR
jgi:hypothetical protein